MSEDYKPIHTPVYAQADLDRARQDGYNDGFRQGKQSRVAISETVSDKDKARANSIARHFYNRFINMDEMTHLEQGMAEVLTTVRRDTLKELSQCDKCDLCEDHHEPN